MLRKILAAVDASPRASGVVAAALELAERFDGVVHLFRVVTPPPEFPPAARNPADDLSEVLRRHAHDELMALANAHARIVIEDLEVDAHEPWRAILEEGKRLDADVIVIGSHGYAGWDRVLGTVAAKVVNHADRNVLVVHERPLTRPVHGT